MKEYLFHIFFYIIFQCIGTLDWIRSEGHTGVIRYKIITFLCHCFKAMSLVRIFP